MMRKKAMDRESESARLINASSHNERGAVLLMDELGDLCVDV
jgi:hypothetical protein